MNYTMKLKNLFIVVFSLFVVCSSAQDLDQTLALADQAFERNDYENALFHFQRIAFFSSNRQNTAVLGRIADCYYALGDFERALEYYDHAYFEANHDKEKWDYLFKKIATYLEAGNYYTALVELLGIDAEEASDIDQRKQVFLATTYFGLEQFDNAGKHFLAALPPDQINERKQIADLYNNPKNFSRPNPKTAFILSVILPGSGQLYSGDGKSAINSFLLTSAFVGLVLYLSVRIHPVEAILTGSPWFQRYYQGGFDHAEQTAINERQKRRNIIYHQSLSIIAGE